MATFLLQLAEGRDAVIEADVAGRTDAGEVVLERVDDLGRCERLHTYRAEAVTAVFRRAPVDGGGYGWLPQPADGSWWCY
ncbi:hypothetical protein ACL02U_10915 [Streptomyces sp. MS06]|uniref:hypothetical protein n=1 Tax=Streptomyces sp. MS06 TaxID=3385974 RepID=UPI0039A35E8E